MDLLDQTFSARKPSLDEARGDRHLLVWGELGHWMVVDAELRSLLRRLKGKKPLRRVLRDHAKKWRKSQGAVKREVPAIIEALRGRDIVFAGALRPPAEIEEPLSIANLTINLTNRCNLRCSFCYNADRNSAELPMEDLMDAVAAGKDVLERDASFIILGGEPLLSPERLWPALDGAGKLFGPAPMVSTNGTLLGAENVAALADRRVEVQVSLDSADAERHDAGRGEGVHAKAVAGVERLVDAGVHTILSMVYARDGAADFEPYLDLALKLGANEARFIPLRQIGGGLDNAGRAPDQLATFHALCALLTRRPEFRPLLARDLFSILVTSCRTSHRRTSCGVGRRVVFVDADGAVYPCPNHVGPQWLAGNLATDRLDHILRDSPVMQKTRERYQVSRYSACESCPFRHWCAGDCRGEVVALTDDPFAPSPHCEALKQVYREILWMLADDTAPLGLTASPDGRSVMDSFV